MRRESERTADHGRPERSPGRIGDRDAYLRPLRELARLRAPRQAERPRRRVALPRPRRRACAEHLLALGARLAVVTLGPDGALAVSGAGEAHVASPTVEVVDTVGAGDAFGAGLLRALWASDALTPDAVAQLDDVGARGRAVVRRARSPRFSARAPELCRRRSRTSSVPGLPEREGVARDARAEAKLEQVVADLLALDERVEPVAADLTVRSGLPSTSTRTEPVPVSTR